MFANKNLRTAPSLINSERSDKPNDSLEENCRVTAGKRKARTNDQSPTERQKVAGHPTQGPVIDLTLTSDEEPSPTRRQKVAGHPTQGPVIDLTLTSDEEPSPTKRQKVAGHPTRVPVIDLTLTSDEEPSPTERQKVAGHPTQVPVIGLTQTGDLSSSTTTGFSSSQDDFEAKYEQLELLGQGGFGCVYAGHRKTDNLPVAIKRIAKEGVSYQRQVIMGQMHEIPVEVILMQRMAAGDDSIGKSAAVSLLDWYNVDYEVLLVMERPVPSVDVAGFLTGRLDEQETKYLMSQLVDAAVEMHSRGVFHQDMKPENVLIDASTGVPRVRIIDFGCGSLVSEERHPAFQGTADYVPPEYLMQRTYEAGPTTVWQLGAMMYELLSGWIFETKTFISDHKAAMYELEMLEVTQDCKDFLNACLTVEPTQRAILEHLPLHPWLNQLDLAPTHHPSV